MSTELEQVNKAVAEFDRVAAGLGQLKQTYGGVIFDVTVPKGMDAAKEARKAVRDVRYSIEHARSEGKGPLLGLGRKLDSDAKAITAALLEIEEPIHMQIRTEEERVEREKQARIEAEVRRVNGIQSRIEEIRINSTLSLTSGSELVKSCIDRLMAMEIDDSFAEFAQQAHDAKAAGLYRLNQQYAEAQAREAERIQIDKDRAELAQRRAEQDRRDAEDKARRDEEERIAKSARDAETARVAEENRKTAEANQAERDRIAAEDKRQADERARLEADQAALAAARAPAAQIKAPPARKALRADMGNGLIVQRGDDGHWIMIKHGGKQAAINVEVMLGRGGVASEVFIGWIDAQIDGKKKTGS